MNFVSNQEFCSSVESHRLLLNIIDDLTRVETNKSMAITSLPFNDIDFESIPAITTRLPPHLHPSGPQLTATRVANTSTLPDRRVYTKLMAHLFWKPRNSDSYIANFHPLSERHTDPLIQDYRTFYSILSNIKPSELSLLPNRKKAALKLKAHFWADTSTPFPLFRSPIGDQPFDRILKAITGWHVWTIFTIKSL